MKKKIVIISILYLLNISSIFAKMDFFAQAGGFGLFPLNEIPYSNIGANNIIKNAYGLNLKFGAYSLKSNFSYNFNFHFGEAVFNTKSTLPEIYKIKETGKHLQVQFEAMYCLFQRRYITPYLSLGIGFSGFQVDYSYFEGSYGEQVLTYNSVGPSSGFCVNLGTGLYIPLSKHFDGYLMFQTPVYVLNLSTSVPKNEKTDSFPFMSIGAGISYKLKG